MNRKRILRLVGGAFMVLLILGASRTCSADNADVTFEFVAPVGDAIDRLDASVLRGDEVVASFIATDLKPEDVRRWRLDLDPGRYTLELELLSAGKVVRSTRRLEAIERAVIRVDLDRE